MIIIVCFDSKLLRLSLACVLSSMFAFSESFFPDASINTHHLPISSPTSLPTSMSTNSTRKIHVLVRASSNSRKMPEIEVACTLPSKPKPPLDSSYYWCKETLEDPSGVKIGYLWARVPSNHQSQANCTILRWCDTDDALDLLIWIEDDITAHVTEEIGKRYRIGKLSWDAGDERIGEWAHGYMHMRTNEDCEDDGAWDWERHVWWDTGHVEVPTS